MLRMSHDPRWKKMRARWCLLDGSCLFGPKQCTPSQPSHTAHTHLASTLIMQWWLSLFGCAGASSWSPHTYIYIYKYICLPAVFREGGCDPLVPPAGLCFGVWRENVIAFFSSSYSSSASRNCPFSCMDSNHSQFPLYESNSVRSTVINSQCFPCCEMDSNSSRWMRQVKN